MSSYSSTPPSVRPSQKRCRSPTPAAPASVGLAPSTPTLPFTPANLLPPYKRTMLTTKQGISSDAIEQLIAKRVDDALTAYEANQNNGNGNGSHDETNGSARRNMHTALGIDATYEISWKELMKMMTEVYCLRNEIQKMESESWNLIVKNNDVCGNYKRVGHMTKDCRTLVAATNHRAPVANQKTTITCYECGKHGHYRCECPKLKNQNCGNQTGNGEAWGRVYALGGREEIKTLMSLQLSFRTTTVIIPALRLNCSRHFTVVSGGNKMHKAFPLPVIEFPLPEEVPTASEQSAHYQKKREATAMKISLLLKDSYKVPATAASAAPTGTTSDETGKKKGKTVTVTVDDMQKRKNDVKAITTLLLSLPDEHQLRFSSETLEQTFNRLQMIVSQLQFMDVEIEHDDLNQKFLTSLAPEWLMHTIKKSETNSQNMAFISSAKYSRGNENINTASVFTASVSTASTNVPTASANIGVASISQDTACAYIASQSRKKISIQGTDVAWFDKSKVECFNYHKMGHFARKCRAPRSQDRGRRDNYRQGSKVEEQAPKALMAIDGVGWDWSYMANDEENHVLVAEKEAPTEFALMANTSAESKVFDNSLCSKDYNKNIDSLKSKITDLTDKLFDVKNMIYHYKLGLAQVESRLAEHRDRGIKYCEKIRGLEYKAESSNDYIKILKKELKLIKKEKRTGLPEFKDDTVTDYSRPAPTIESSSDDAQNKSPSVTKEASPSTISPKSFIKFVKANDSQLTRKSKELEQFKILSIRSKLCDEENACFNCGDFNHLAYDGRKRVKKGTSRSQNNTHKSFTPRPTVHKPYRPPMRPMRSNMNVRSQYRAPWVPTVNKNFPPVNRKSSTVSRNFSTVNRKFPTANRKFPTGDTKFSTADMGKKGKAVKPSACWFWKPSQNLSNKGLNSNSVSVMFMKYTYINTQGRLKSVMAWVPKEN
nr:hypothetical protein [Tanacetum cinerariifolium]